MGKLEDSLIKFSLLPFYVLGLGLSDLLLSHLLGSLFMRHLRLASKLLSSVPLASGVLRWEV